MLNKLYKGTENDLRMRIDLYQRDKMDKGYLSYDSGKGKFEIIPT